MEPTISIAQLRQNPTAMIRAVKAGSTYTLTERGQAIASISPLRRPVWQSSTAINELLRGLGPDPVWAEELQEARTEATLEES